MSISYFFNFNTTFWNAQGGTKVREENEVSISCRKLKGSFKKCITQNFWTLNPLIRTSTCFDPRSCFMAKLQSEEHFSFFFAETLSTCKSISKFISEYFLDWILLIHSVIFCLWNFKLPFFDFDQKQLTTSCSSTLSENSGKWALKYLW